MSEAPSALKRVGSAHRGVHVSVAQPPAEADAKDRSPTTPRPSYSGILTDISERETMRQVWRSLKHAVPHVPVTGFPPVSFGDAPPAAGTMRIVVISDTHGWHAKLPALPAGDVLVHCGNFTHEGSADEVKAFVEWLRAAKKQFKHIVVVGGSRDAALDDGVAFPVPREDSATESVSRRAPSPAATELAAALAGVAMYVPHGAFVIDDVKFFASQYGPQVDQGAFGYNRRTEGHEVWQKLVEAKPDIVVTHVPPLGQRDMVTAVGVIGCADLLDAVEATAPALHLFGHVHQGRGASTNGKTLFVNASCVVHAPQADEAPGAAEVIDQKVKVMAASVVDYPKSAEARAEWSAALAKYVENGLAAEADSSTTDL